MMIPKQAISRRTVLRGVGATLALPLFERMAPTTHLARAAAAPVRRFCTVYVPNGIVMERWTPATEGTGFDFTPTLLPLQPFRDHLLVLSGLDNTGARSRSGASGAHAKPAGAFMTGIEPLPTTGSSSLSLGISMDQLLANTIGQQTPLPSLELGLEGADTVNGVGTCDVGFSCAYQNRLAWSGPSTGQASVLQSRASCAASPHSAPPSAGAGSSQYLAWVPPPQVASQAVQAPQAPSTGQDA